MKLTLHNDIDAMYVVGNLSYNPDDFIGIAKAKLEVSVSGGYTEKTLTDEWDDLKWLLDEMYQKFRNELINTFSAGAVWDALTENLTGTVSVTAGTDAVVGVGTLFTSELSVGNEITIAGESFHVASITDDLNLTLYANHVAGASAVVATTDKQKQALVRNYVWKSAETTPNLDLLYTQAERDQFMEDTVILLNKNDCNFQKVISDGVYWDILPDANGKVQATKLETDVPTDSAVPMTVSFAEMYMNNNSTDTVIATSSTMTKIAGTTTKGEASTDFTHADNKLTYTGTKTKKFKVTITTTTKRATGTGDKLGRFTIFKNDVEETKTLIGNKSIGALIETTFQGVIEMVTNDYIEMFVENVTDAEDFTVKNMMVIAVEIK